MPTPSEAERAAVLAQSLPTNIDFELQRAIYLWRQQGFPSRPAEVLVQFDPDLLTITAAVALAEQHGVEVGFQYERRSFFDGIVALDAVPALAVERGITKVGLQALVPVDSFPCPTPSGRTPVPITCGPASQRP
jgi:hypothetical protein